MTSAEMNALVADSALRSVYGSNPLADVLVELKALREEVKALRATLAAPVRPVHALTIAQAAERLGCTKRTVFDLLRAKKLVRAPRVGREARVTVASLEALEVGTKSPLPPRSRRAISPSWPFDEAALDRVK